MKKASFLWSTICILFFPTACGKLAPAMASTSTNISEEIGEGKYNCNEG